jgi:hypothetical protein
MRRLVLALVIGAAALPAAASAGGWATAGLAPPDEAVAAGDVWRAEVTIKQHGQTPLDGVQPAVIISNDSGKSLRFAATPAGKPGVYVAEVTFPTGGTWNYAVYDGFSAYGGAQTHTFAPVTIPGGAGGGEFFPLGPSLLGIALALGLAVLLVLAVRRRPSAPAAPQPTH